MSDQGQEMRDMVVADCHDKMAKAIEHLKDEFSGVRTGRASSGLVDKLRVDYYGSDVPLQQLAGFSVPEPRVLVISQVLLSFGLPMTIFSLLRFTADRKLMGGLANSRTVNVLLGAAVTLVTVLNVFLIVKTLA